MSASRFFTYVSLWAVLLLSSAAVTAASAAPPELSVLGPSPLKLATEQGSDKATGYFTLLNPGQGEAPVSAEFQAASSAVVSVKSLYPKAVPGTHAERMRVIFSGLEGLDEKVEGQLVVLGGVEPVAVAVEIAPGPQPSATWPLLIVIVSLAVALIVALAVVGNGGASQLKLLLKPAPGPKWSFESWATTLTVVGALFGTVLGEATLPEFPTQITKSSLVNLSLLFGALVVLGPFVFQALRRPRKNATEEDSGLWGWNLTLLIACTITLWAVLGELGTLALLCWELTGGDGTGVVLLATLFIVALLAISYFWVSVSQLITHDWSPVAGVAVAAAAVVPMAPVGNTRHNWPLL